MAPLLYSKDVTLSIRPRPSQRVPFGTGQGMQTILNNDLKHTLYNPNIFVLLKSWINILNTSQDDSLLDELKEIVPDYPYFKKIEKLVKQPCPRNQQIRRRHTFFDCFQTMRFIHHLRETHYPSIPWWEALNQSIFMKLPKLEQDSISTELQIQVADLEYTLRGNTYGI